MKKNILQIFPAFLFFILIPISSNNSKRSASQDFSDNDTSIFIRSSDTLLVSIFDWAKRKSLGYKGNDNDPVGPWYEAALPKREAFCIRDVSHQCIGSEIIGLSRQNHNMLTKFVENISEGKDYCSYWEINRYDKPAPVDYSTDNDFWYNLNANFDIIDACYKLFQWTGDSSYIFDPVFNNFFQLTLNEYIDRWQLQHDRIMNRAPIMNLKPETIKYRHSRGIPSYDEAQEDMIVSGDLIGMIFNGFVTYSRILKLQNKISLSRLYQDKADKYLKLIDSLWWNRSSGNYYSFYNTKKQFYTGGAGKSEFLLWYNVIKGPERIKKLLLELDNTQVEVLSYLPALFYRYGFDREAYDFLLKIYVDKRRDYPEASSGAIEGIIKGMMGIEPSADDGKISTCPHLTEKTGWLFADNIPVFSGYISVKHENSGRTLFTNRLDRAVRWKAMFPGSFEQISIDGNYFRANHTTDAAGHPFSYLEIPVSARSKITAEVVRSAGKVLPSAAQLNWAQSEMGVLIHFDMPVFEPTYDFRKEWNYHPDASIFNPGALDTDQWIKAAKDAGASYAILVAKHCSGFSLWPTKAHPYSVKNTPWRNGQGDIVKDFVASCRKYGIKPGIYASTTANGYLKVDNPGKVVSGDPEEQKKYNEIVKMQLTELWSGYGDLFEVWFDGGVLPQEKGGFDVLSLLKKYQPGAIAFQGPFGFENNIRWVGNEEGVAPYPCWSRADSTKSESGVIEIKGLNGNPDGLFWSPGESDFPLRQNSSFQGGWFWHKDQDERLRSIGELLDRYCKSIGRNTNMLLGIVIDDRGLVPEADVKILKEFGNLISKTFANSLGMTAGPGNEFELRFKSPEQVRYVVIMEDIEKGERIREYKLSGKENGRWQVIGNGSCIGHKRIEVLKNGVFSEIKLEILKSDGIPLIKSFECFGV